MTREEYQERIDVLASEVLKRVSFFEASTGIRVKEIRVETGRIFEKTRVTGINIDGTYESDGENI